MREALLIHLAEQGPSATWHFRKRGFGSAAECRKELRKLEKEGIVKVHKRYSSANNLVWELIYDNGRAEK